MYRFKELKKSKVHTLGIIKLGLDAEKSQQSLSLSLGLIFFTVSFIPQAKFLRKKEVRPVILRRVPVQTSARPSWWVTGGLGESPEDSAGPLGRWETKADERQTDTPCRESLGIEFI